MNQKLILIIFGCLSLFSCKQTAEPNEQVNKITDTPLIPTEKPDTFLKKALDIYYSSELEDSIKLDSSLAFTKKALESNSKNVDALLHQQLLFLRMKDINSLLETNDALISLRPNIPTFLAQKAIYLELKGDSINSVIAFKKALSKYEEYLKNDTLNFDLRFEYIQMLEAYGDSISANRNLEIMNTLTLEAYQIEILEIYKQQPSFKTQLIKYWNGEISFKQIGE